MLFALVDCRDLPLSGIPLNHPIIPLFANPLFANPNQTKSSRTTTIPNPESRLLLPNVKSSSRHACMYVCDVFGGGGGGGGGGGETGMGGHLKWEQE